MNLNKIKEASKDNVLLDSEGNNLFIGDIVAYRKAKEYGGGFKVHKDIIKEIRKDTKKIKLLDSKYLTYANCVLKISGIASQEELDKNEELVKTTINNEKEKQSKQRKEKITTRNILIAYSNKNNKKYISGLIISSDPGKSIKFINVINDINKFKQANNISDLYVYSINKEFINSNLITSINDIQIINDRYFPHTLRENRKIEHIDFPYSEEDKQIIDEFIRSKTRQSYIPSTETKLIDILNYLFTKRQDPLYNEYSFFKFYNDYNQQYLIYFLYDEGIYEINLTEILIAFKKIFQIK